MAQSTFTDKLRALAEHHERVAAGLRLALEALNGHEVAQAEISLPAKLKRAAKLRKQVGLPLAPESKWSKDARMEQRRRTAEKLASMSLTEPGTLGKFPYAPMLANGYIKKKGAGYVRTNKAFIP